MHRTRTSKDLFKAQCGRCRHLCVALGLLLVAFCSLASPQSASRTWTFLESALSICPHSGWRCEWIQCMFSRFLVSSSSHFSLQHRNRKTKRTRNESIEGELRGRAIKKKRVLSHAWDFSLVLCLVEFNPICCLLSRLVEAAHCARFAFTRPNRLCVLLSFQFLPFSFMLLRHRILILTNFVQFHKHLIDAPCLGAGFDVRYAELLCKSLTIARRDRTNRQIAFVRNENSAEKSRQLSARREHSAQVSYFEVSS
jgi:hypothetical protein